MASKKKKKKHPVFRLFVKLQFLLLLLLIAAVGYYYAKGYGQQIKALKAEADALVKRSVPSDFEQGQMSVVYDASGNVISTLKGEKESYYLALEDTPFYVITAIISIEDKKFYKHDGVDYRAIVRAFKAMIENGEVTQGGSTITMQLARNIYLSQEQTWQRKVEEIFIAWNLEKKYTKDQILEFYLNNIYFGSGYYGIQSASRGFFDCDVQGLSLSQIAFLLAIPNNPTYYDPIENMDNTLSRRNRILKNMLDDGKIDSAAYQDAITESIVLKRPASLAKNDYVETYAYYCAARALMEQEGFTFRYEFETEEERERYDEKYSELYTECQKKMYAGGYSIYTSLDLDMQETLQAAVSDTLSGFTEVNEEGIYTLQASAVCIDNTTGYVRAIVGGRGQDYPGYTLNRAYQSFRQPGSAIKPLTVYTPSLENGYTPESILVDEPIEDGPRNANGAYVGEVTLRTAVEKSINTIAWKLYDELTPQTGLSYLQKMNFSKLDREDYRLVTALGGFTRGVSALEMASGYAAIENDGKYRNPTCIVKILGASGETIYASPQTEKEVYHQNAARMMTDILQGVFTNGTAKGLGLDGMPCAGKTGTTNDRKDGWFVGYTRYYTTSVWVGYDMPKKLDDLAGSTYPGKIWQKFMGQIHEDLPPMEFLPYAQLSDEHQPSAQFGENTESQELLGTSEKEEIWHIEGSETLPEEQGETPQPGNAPKQGDMPQTGSAPENGGMSQPGNMPEDGVTPQPGNTDETLPEDGVTPQPGNTDETPPEEGAGIEEEEEEIEDIPPMELD